MVQYYTVMGQKVGSHIVRPSKLNSTKLQVAQYVSLHDHELTVH